MVPAAGVAVAVLTNGAGAAPLAHEIFTHTLDIEMPARPVPPADPAPVEPWMYGTYRGSQVDFVLEAEGGRAFLKYLPRNAVAAELVGQHTRDEVVRYDDTAIITAEPELGSHYVLSFVGRDDEGRAEFLHSARAAYRIA